MYHEMNWWEVCKREEGFGGNNDVLKFNSDS